MKVLKRAVTLLLTLCILFGSCLPAVLADDTEITTDSGDESTEDSGLAEAKIHFITTPAYMNSILVECNGHFGMIDSGEDEDYPDGSDPRYPARAGLYAAGVEQKVIDYLHSVGVTSENFDFYIGTHPHSDHIGSADEVIREFHPKRVYLEKYDDSYITDSARLWDNQYVYDCAVAAAEEVGSVLIQEFSEDAPVTPEDGSDVGNPVFTLGDAMTIEIVNYEVDQTEGFFDANCWSLGVVLEVNGYRAYCAGDINDFNGREAKLAKQIGDVDLMVLGHHGYNGSNSNYYVTKLNPEIIVNCGAAGSFTSSDFSGVSKSCSVLDTINAMLKKGSRLYCVTCYNAVLDALVFDFADGLSNNAQGIYVPYWWNTGMQSYCDGRARKCNGMITAYLSGRYWGAWFENSTTPVTDKWICSGGTWYYAWNSGRLAWGLNKISGTWYYFDETTFAMQTGWVNYQDAWYWFGSSGAMQTGWQKINKRWYYFGSSGIMQTGWVEDGGARYYLDPTNGDMKTGWLQDGDSWYWLTKDGSMATGWQKVGKKWYYFDPETGVMESGWQNIDDAWYYLAPVNGDMKTGWLQLGDAWYYLDPVNGDRKTGIQLIGEDRYCFDEDGIMQTGFVTVDEKTYYFDEDGVLQTGFVTVDEKTYYFDEDGVMQTGFVTVDEKTYYFDEDGVLQTGFVTVDEKTYYFDEDGAMVTGTQTIDGTEYHFGDDGALVTTDLQA